MCVITKCTPFCIIPVHFQIQYDWQIILMFIFPLEVNYDLPNYYSKKKKWLFNVQKIITFLFSGIPYQQKSVQLKCVVECYPLCDLVWHRNNTPIPITNKRSLAGGIFQGSGQLDTYSRFTVQTEHKPANSVENVLEHVQSVLTLVST